MRLNDRESEKAPGRPEQEMAVGHRTEWSEGDWHRNSDLCQCPNTEKDLDLPPRATVRPKTSTPRGQTAVENENSGVSSRRIEPKMYLLLLM